MTENTRAPADSPCELLPCPFCAETDVVLCEDAQAGVSDALCTRCGATAPAAAWNHRAGVPPALSARPNEAEEAIRRVESNYPESVFPEGGTSIDCQSASMARLTCRNIRYELKRVVDERDENEADAPRERAVAFQVLYADKTIELQWADDAGERDDYNDERHGYPVNISPLYLETPPAPAMQADGVREKYRAVTQDDADELAEHLSNIAIDEWPSRTEIFAGLLHIGAVVPDEPK